ncbi:hypothetical protein [Enterobacter sichuanensis]|uniref:hypothetical protein n=1 Tax=Enterobacter sichuanensis TaxID=2071710 RepID=UPI00217EE26B|nr:hypothetical protein [Enterobacter sichuanensis]
MMNAKELELKLSDALQREDILKEKLAESQREFRAADATIENLQMQVEKLAAENAGLKNALEWLYETVSSESVSIPNEKYSSVTNAAQVLSETPATDAFLAEVRAQGIDQWIASRNGRWNGTTAEAERFAAQIRKGGATEEGQSFLSNEDCHAFVKAFTKGAAQ